LIDSVFNKDINPYKQAGIVVAASIIISAVLKLVALSGLYVTELLTYWIIAAAFILFYAAFNSLLSLSSKDPNSYWGQSILGYAAVVILTGFAAYFFSGLSIYEAASMKWIYMVLTLVYIIFLTIVRLMRKIVEIAIKQDKKLRGEE
jgi:hypothetical protein